MHKRIIVTAAFVVLMSGGAYLPSAHHGEAGNDSTAVKAAKSAHALSFKTDVQPLINKKCMSCHYPENEFNSSHLVMATYDDVMKGGKHGSPIVPGNASKSLLYQKLQPNPPFGRQMPDEKDNKLSPEEVRLIADWINQGAKK